MTTKAEFLDWKTSPTTIKVFQGLQEYEAILTEELVLAAGIDPLADRYKSGYIAALRDMYRIRVDDTGEAE